MNTRNYKIASCIIVWTFCIQMKAQTVDTFREQADITPSVETWKVTRHGGLSPSLYTGAMQWSLPLYTYKDYDFELPVSLEYSYDGFRPGESTGSIGLGWALNVGGVITREVKGLRDECFMQQTSGRYVYGCYYAWRDRVAFSADAVELLRGTTIYSETLSDDDDETFLETLRDDLPNDVLVCRHPQYNACYDIEPDVFRFNFCGHKGEFRFDSDGRIDIFCPDEPSCDFGITVGTMTGPDCGTFNFKIKTADGYEYSFGTTANSWEYSTSLRYSTDDPKGLSRTNNYGEQTITAWKLTSIKSPSGMSLDFTYDETPDIEVFVFDSYTPAIKRLDLSSDSSETVPSYRDKRLSVCYTRLLKQITLKSSQNSHILAEFNWTERTATQNEICEANYNASGAILPNIRRDRVNRVLSSIFVRNGGGTIIENICFGHDMLGSTTRRLLLSSVETKALGKWTFRYASVPSGNALPTADNLSEVDIYGYWGGNGITDLRGRSNMNGGGLAQQGACENHSFAMASTGALVHIDYPTGGYTDIEYESNYIRYLLERDWREMPHLETFGKVVGGVRVKSVSDWSWGALARRKTYEYEDGVLWYYPRLVAECEYYKTLTDPLPESSSTVCLSSTFYTRTGFGTMGYSPRLGYGKVTECHIDGSRTEYSFLGWQDYPDYYSMESINTICTDTSPRNDYVKTQMLNMFLPASQDWSLFRGTQKNVSEYDADGVLRYCKSLSYDVETPVGVIEGVNLFSISGSMMKFRFRPILTSVVETDNDLRVKKEWTRDGNGRISTEKTTDLQSGYEKSVDYTYCAGLSASNASVCPGAVKVIQTSVKESAESQSLVTNRAEFSYNRSDKSAFPSSISIYRIDTPNTEKIIKQQFASIETITITRDNHLRPTCVNFSGGKSISYTWDTYGRNILKRTENGDDGITSYSWKDMVGLMRVDYPSGLNERYTYDAHNRLSTIRDSDGYLINRITGLLSSEQNGKTSHIITQRFLDTSARTSLEDMVYYDGLGREALTVELSESNSYPSILQPVCYDVMDRADSAVFLPYAVNTFSGILLDSLNTYNWKAAQADWYEDNYNDGAGAFAERAYERWRGGRILSERKPGANYLSAGKAVHYQYGANANGDGVFRFSMTRTGLDSASVKCTGTWEASKLAKTIRISEENDTTVVFSDALGRMLLSRNINNGVNHDTYYVRDLRDSLALVIQPEGSSRLKKDMVISFEGTFVRNYCFGWLYDGAGRLTWRHAPGDGGTRMAYDQRGRMVYCDDALLRSKGKGRYFLYDSYDRLTEEGLCVPSVGISGMRDGLVYNVSITQMIISREMIRELAYRSATVPAGGIPSDMAFEEVSGVVAAGDVSNTRCLGAVSYERLRELSNTLEGFTRRAYWYDARGRIIQMLEKTSDGWSSRYSMKYDFAGNVLVSDEKHTDSSGTTHEIKTENTYDGWCRLVKSARTLDGEALRTVTYEYDELGRLQSTSGNKNGSSYCLQESLERNMLGWITGVKTRLPNTLLFNNQISYRYDGLVNEASFYQKLSGSSAEKTVRNEYDYDHLGRFTGNTRYVNGIQTDVGTEKDIEYDLNGNLEFIRRNENGKSTDYGFVYRGNILDMAYINPYTEMLESWFSSDANGNLTQNGYDGVGISYNFLNLPSMVNGLKYTYLSDGAKFSVTKSDSSRVVYRGSFVYEVRANGSIALGSVEIPEGRVYCSDTPDGEPWECWDVKDYLGNVRAVVRPNGGLVIETSDYLPYGTQIEQSHVPYQVGRNRWYYAGKELQDFDTNNSADVIDFGARYYSYGIGRWTTPDPQAGKYLSTSPYAYCNNNPMNFVDPNGEAVYYSYRGEFVTTDNIDDGKIYLVEDKYLNITANSAVLVRNAFSDGFKEVGGLIIQYRFEEGSNYTVSIFKTVGGDESVRGYILEPEGPDTTTPNMDKRIPEGVYEIDNYHSKKYKDNYIIFNELVPKSRMILYHLGNNGNETEGCLLPGTTYDGNGVVSKSGDKFNELQPFIESVGARNVRTIISNKRLK